MQQIVVQTAIRSFHNTILRDVSHAVITACIIALLPCGATVTLWEMISQLRLPNLCMRSPVAIAVADHIATCHIQ